MLLGEKTVSGRSRLENQADDTSGTKIAVWSLGQIRARLIDAVFHSTLKGIP